jgi:phosphohistidine swiveling domain-containing protein
MSRPPTRLFDPVRGDSQPGQYLTFTNAAEATPDILSPLCWSLWGEATEKGFRQSMCSLGVLSKAEAALVPDPLEWLSRPIYGRQAFNIDVLRPVMSRISTKVADDFERDVLGSVRPDAPTLPAKPMRIPVIAVKAPYVMYRLAEWVQRNFDSTKAWWQRDVLDGSKSHSARGRTAFDDLLFSRDRFVHSFYLHLLVRYQVSAVQGTVLKIAEKIGVPSLGTAALSAQGGVAETVLADDAWRIAHGDMSVEQFIAEHGFHGPNEGNVYTKSWREQPDKVRAMAKAQANRAASERPLKRAERAAQQARVAEAELIHAASGADKVVLRLLLARARSVIPRLEIGKAGYVIPLDGARAAARRLGAEQVDSGRLAEADDVFFLTIDELRQLLDDRLPEAADLIKYRRGTRREYAAMRLPVNFSGMPKPLTAEIPDTVGPVEIRGVAAGGGFAQGRARVVIDPNDDVELDEGDILVCKFTDPSWAPLFSLAEALVIDIGGAASHGAVVARELGIPYVIGTQNGSSLIRDGDQITVDGTNNVVRVVQ